MTNGSETVGLRGFLRSLYYGHDRRAQLFRYGLLAFDIITITFFIATSMLPPDAALHGIDFSIAALLSLDYVARMIIANRPWRFVFRFYALVDLVVIISLLAPIFVENLAFLRVVRMLRLLRSYHMLSMLRRGSTWFRSNESVIQSTINLFVFIFVVTALVFVVEAPRNTSIGNYVDALYFTVTTLTTTGFGDITMTGTVGRILAVVIMVFGVALFLRLIQTIFRPTKVRYTCSKCGLERHDPDAVHCKHCGETISIPTEGEWF